MKMRTKDLVAIFFATLWFLLMPLVIASLVLSMIKLSWKYPWISVPLTISRE